MLEGRYDIFLGQERVGQAVVEQQGLYYCFDCRCKLSGTVICRINVSCNGHQEDLGIPVPTEGWFRLKKKVPVKRLGKGLFRFQVTPRHRAWEKGFVPVYPEEPFAYLSKLQNAFMEVREGQAGVVLPSE